MLTLRQVQRERKSMAEETEEVGTAATLGGGGGETEPCPD